jgi:hypothetical protein
MAGQTIVKLVCRYFEKRKERSKENVRRKHDKRFTVKGDKAYYGNEIAGDFFDRVILDEVEDVDFG